MNTPAPEIGYTFNHTFSFTQRQVEDFSAVTGDRNPIHLDSAYAATTSFKRPIMHGFLSGSIFSKVFGTIYPGEGTIYLEQTMTFRRPMYVDTQYTASFVVTELDAAKNQLVISCQIHDPDNRVTLEGHARLMNPRLFQAR
jgi:acyl dehydratase